MKVQADNINGVYRVEDFEGDVMAEQLFYACLKDNADDSVICAEISDEMAEKINAKYGIAS